MNRATSPTGWARNPDSSPGFTWNPITGCLNHDNGLCRGGGFPCYAFKLANGRLFSRYMANTNVVSHRYANVDAIEVLDPFYPRFWEERLEELKRGYHYTDWSGACAFGAAPKGIFVCDMGDLFGIGIPEAWTRKVLEAIKKDRTDRLYLLTKQAQRLPEFSPFPDNAWVGVTATNSYTWVMAPEYLSKVEAKVRFVSVEPMLERLDTNEIRLDTRHWLDWLIIGACTGTWRNMVDLSAKYPELAVMKWGKKWTAQPRIEWISEIVEACKKANIPYFLKDNLKPLIEWPRDGPWAFQPASNMLRQELPEC